MLDTGYLRALEEAEFLAPGGYYSGASVWREAGLRAVELFVERYVELLAALGRPNVVEHGFLLDEEQYRGVFPEYENVITIDAPQGASQRQVLRPDNMRASVEMLRRRGGAGPVVAVGGLLRKFSGRVAPLFRERYIWPAVQTTQLVDRGLAHETLLRHQQALESLLAAVALPVVSVRTATLSRYGDPCLLTVTFLPDGRPTVLSTAYVMSERYRRALGVDQAVLDIGFTGKVLALVALHHRDHRGLALPSAIAPTQLGIVAHGPGPEGAHAAGSAGVRTTRCSLTVDTRRHRAGRERHLHRLGTPLVLHDIAAQDRAVLTRRFPVERSAPAGAADDSDLHVELRQHDERLLRHATTRFDRALARGRFVQALCAGCARSGARAVFGWLVPEVAAPCDICGRQGMQAFVSEQGRFY